MVKMRVVYHNVVRTGDQAVDTEAVRDKIIRSRHGRPGIVGVDARPRPQLDTGNIRVHEYGEVSIINLWD